MRGVVQTRYNGFGELVEEKQMIHKANMDYHYQSYAPTTGLLQSISRAEKPLPIPTTQVWDIREEYNPLKYPGNTNKPSPTMTLAG